MAEAKKSSKVKAVKPKTKKKAAPKAAVKPIEAASEKPVDEPKVETVVDGTPDVEQELKAVAKAGKHSAKAIKEEHELQAKQERKASSEPTIAEKPKVIQKTARPKSERAGKKYREVYKLIDQTKSYSLTEALELATKTSTTKFDSTVEMHINLGVDPKQADQNVRDIVVLPSGTGKTVRIAVAAETDDAGVAKKAGADIAGIDEVLALLDKEQIDFDVLIATPAMMPKLGKYARLLGPRGLMPNPKSGTVTADVAKAVSDAKGGRVEYRVDQAGIVHLGIGKVSFGPEKLKLNADAVLASVRAAKPSSLKGSYILAMYVTTSMGPSIRIES